MTLESVIQLLQLCLQSPWLTIRLYYVHVVLTNCSHGVSSFMAPLISRYPEWTTKPIMVINVDCRFSYDLFIMNHSSITGANDISTTSTTWNFNCQTKSGLCWTGSKISLSGANDLYVARKIYMYARKIAHSLHHKAILLHCLPHYLTW